MSQSQEILTTAIARIIEQQNKCNRFRNYYRGSHDLAFATEKFVNAFGQLFREFSLNICPAIIDAVADKMEVTGWSLESDGNAAEIAAKTWEIWVRSKMPVRAGEMHKEALTCGDTYVIVWPSKDGKATLYPQPADLCTVEYDPESPGVIVWAFKAWYGLDKFWRAGIYYPDRVEIYQIRKNSKQQPVTLNLEASKLDLIEVVEHDYGIVPVFHFANNADLGRNGISELANAIPLQDALNKTVLDMLVAMEFAAYRQRWAAGIEIEYDDEGKPIPPFKAGIERLWISPSPEAKFGDFEQTDLSQFLEVKNGFRVDLATVTGTPMHYLMLQSASPSPQSGISVEKLESRFLSRVRDRQNSFGQVWADAMALALKIDKVVNRQVTLMTQWADASPLSESERLENLLRKRDLGISERQLLIEAGYGEADIDRILKEREDERMATARVVAAGGEFT
jgi:hypothetical protein